MVFPIKNILVTIKKYIILLSVGGNFNEEPYLNTDWLSVARKNSNYTVERSNTCPRINNIKEKQMATMCHWMWYLKKDSIKQLDNIPTKDA